MTERITIDTDVCNGRACIRDTRIMVGDVLRLYAEGLTSDQILDQLPALEQADLESALLYAARRLGYPGG